MKTDKFNVLKGLNWTKVSRKAVPGIVKNHWKKSASVAFTVLFAFLLAGKLKDASVSRAKESTAEKVVKILYDFGSAEQLEEQEHQLRGYVTDPVYNQLVVDNDNRELRAYMAFYNNASTVDFVDVTDSYVIFRLDSMSIDSGRLFIFAYKVNVSGKICEVFESELVDFIGSRQDGDFNQYF